MPIGLGVSREGGRVDPLNRIASLTFADESTALAKLRGPFFGYWSLLRLRDGWSIVREVKSMSAASKKTAEEMGHVASLVATYMKIEHGGGVAAAALASQIFHPDASLLTIGDGGAELSPDVDSWEAPAGTLNEISRATYITGVNTQTPHKQKAAKHDSLLTIDMLPCATVAAVVANVGNGSQTRVFTDHLILCKVEDGWQIVSKTFAANEWP